MTCCVLGLGNIGLPTAALIASRGHRVLGVDVNPSKIRLESRIQSLEVEVRRWVSEALQSGRFRVSTAVEDADVFVICVPTPHDPERPESDLHDFRCACDQVAKVLCGGNLVIIESTVPVGTTRGVAMPILERESGLVAGRDFYLAFCPERAMPGRLAEELVQNARVVGGIHPRSTERAATFYRTLVEGEVLETDAETAELVKLMENTYVAVNVALANEYALVAESLGVEVHEAIRLANRHPRVRILRPGPGVGGHCIPVDPWFLVQASPEATATIRAALTTNALMPRHVADAVVQALRRVRKPLSGARVVLLGVTYKEDVSDCRGSPAAAIAQHLGAHGILVSFHDPIAVGFPYPVERDLLAAARGADALVLVNDHAAYAALDREALLRVMGTDPCFLDCRGRHTPMPGFQWWTLGRGLPHDRDGHR